MRKVAYIDVFPRRFGRGLLIIANDIRHNELWRRNDPQTPHVAKGYKNGGKVQVFNHQIP